MCAFRFTCSPTHILGGNSTSAANAANGVMLVAGPALTGHIEVSVTKLPWFHNMRVRSFESNEKVCGCASCPPCSRHCQGLWKAQGSLGSSTIGSVPACDATQVMGHSHTGCKDLPAQQYSLQDYWLQDYWLHATS